MFIFLLWPKLKVKHCQFEADFVLSHFQKADSMNWWVFSKSGQQRFVFKGIQSIYFSLPLFEYRYVIIPPNDSLNKNVCFDNFLLKVCPCFSNTCPFQSFVTNFKVSMGFGCQRNRVNCLLKFGYSEKATKFEKIFDLKFDTTQ